MMGKYVWKVVQLYKWQYPKCATVCDTDEDWGEAECAVSGHERKLAEPDLLLGLEKLEGEGVGDVRKGEGRGNRRRKRERSQHRGIGGAARDEKLLDVRMKKKQMTQREMVEGETVIVK